MTDKHTLVEKMLYTAEHGIFDACEAGMLFDFDEAATRITALEAEKAELVHILDAITAMQALRYGDATRTHMALIGLCVTARATLAKHQEGEGK